MIRSKPPRQQATTSYSTPAGEALAQTIPSGDTPVAAPFRPTAISEPAPQDLPADDPAASVPKTLGAVRWDPVFE